MTAGAGGTAMSAVRRAGGTQGAGMMSPVSWRPNGDIEFPSWVRVGQRLGAMTRCSQWWLGDWIRFGTSRWGEKYKQAARITGYDVQTLRNIAYVAGQVEVSRRRDDLTWSHHAEVCALQPEEQDRWLEAAASGGMSVADLRIEMRAARRGEDGGDPHRKVHLVTCPECEHRFAAQGRVSG
jgi:hypothetical protein